MGRRTTKVPSRRSTSKSIEQQRSMAETPRTPERLDTSEVDSLIKTPPFTSRGGRTSPTWDEYHDLEYFDINPKTDYTYAYSGSYSPRHFHQPDVIPNMSRQRIDSHASGYLLHQSGMDSPSTSTSVSDSPYYRPDTGEITPQAGWTPKTSNSKKTFNGKGMVLRSGNRLSALRRKLEQNSLGSPNIPSQTSGVFLPRSLDSELEVAQTPESPEHSPVIRHMYDRSTEDISLNTNQSHVYSPIQRIWKKVVTTETIEYIDADGVRRVRRVDDVEGDDSRLAGEANTSANSSWFGKLFGSPISESTVIEEKEEKENRNESEIEVETEEHRGRGWFGMFQRSETSSTEEEELNKQSKETQMQSVESQTTMEEDVRRRGLAAESDSEEMECEEEEGWKSRLRNRLRTTTEEKWQTEASEKGESVDPGSGWFDWLWSTSTTDVSETEHDRQGSGWFGGSKSDETVEESQTEKSNSSKAGWFGWTSISEPKEDEDSNKATEESRPGWFSWTTSSTTTSTSEEGRDEVDTASKSRLFSWLSSEEKVVSDTNETETKSPGWFARLWRSAPEDGHELPAGETRNGKNGKARRRSSGRKVRFSLDSDDESETRSQFQGMSIGSSSMRSSSRHSSSSNFSDPNIPPLTWMQSVLMVITAVTTIVSDIFSPFTEGYISQKSRLVIWRRLRIAEMWIASRSVGGFCCLCLPVLLLLPLLLGYLYSEELLEQARSSIGSFHLLQVNKTLTHTAPLPYVDPSTINIKIKQFFDENHHKYMSSGVSQEEVQRIAQGIVAKELEDMKLALLQDIHQIKADQRTERTNQRQSFTNIDTKLQDFLNRFDSLENELAALRASTQMKSEGLKTDYQEQMDILEQQMKTLGGDFSNLQISHLELLANVRNCCKNDSFYALTVRKHVKEIFGQMMSGGGSGSDDSHSSFLLWLQTNYAQKEDMDRKLTAVSEEITQKILTIAKEQASNVYIQSGTQAGPNLSEDYIRWIVDDALLKYSADQVGMADYALESNGGSVVSVRCSETYYKKTALVSVFGIPLWYTTNSPRTVIQPDVHPGECWAFKGVHGYLVIQLAFPIKPSGFSLEHIPKALSPYGNIDSAPKQFTVLGLNDEKDKAGLLLGNYTYSDSGKPIQYFPIQTSNPNFFNFIELKILGNHGNPEYTCLYRFRVHGVPYKQTL